MLYSNFLKRVVDCVGSLTGLVLLSPMIASVWLLVRYRLGGPALFRQVRVGKDGHPFVLHKFRTMDDRRDPSGALLPDAERLTSFGWWLRRLSLDELPQFWDVLRGDMSLVGPRPLPPEYLARYTVGQRRRHMVKPGITGWAQVNGRNALTWEQKFELDVWYVDKESLWLDLKILMLTVGQVLGGRGISQPGHATMPEFRGSLEKPRAEA